MRTEVRRRLPRASPGIGGVGATCFEEIAPFDDAAVRQFALHHGWPVRLRQRGDGCRSAHDHVVRPFTDLHEVWSSAPDGPWLVGPCSPLAPVLDVTLDRRPSAPTVVRRVTERAPTDRPCARPLAAGGTRERAVAVAAAVADRLEAVGVVTVTMLVAPDGRLIVDDVTW